MGVARKGTSAKAWRTVAHLPFPAVSISATGRLLRVNRALQMVLGPTSSGQITWMDIIHPDDRSPEIGSTNDQHSDRSSQSIRLLTLSGDYRWFNIVLARSRCRRWIGLLTDVDELKRIEAETQQNLSQIRSVLDNVPAQISSANARGEVDYRNGWDNQFSGIDPATALGKGWQDAVHPDDVENVMAVWRHSVETGEPMNIVHRLRRADNSYRWFQAKVIASHDQSGNVRRWYGVISDIHDEKTAQEALIASNRELAQILETVPAMIFAVTRDGETAYMNQRIKDYYGVDANLQPDPDHTRLRSEIREKVHPDDAAAVEASVMKSFLTGTPFAMKYRNFRFDGAARWVEGRIDPMRDENGEIVRWYGSVFDIHDEIIAKEHLRLATDKLTEANQIAALAELSACVAHEVNQPLTAIVSNSIASKRWLAAEPVDLERVKTIADRIVRDANSAAEIVGRVRALFKQNGEGRILVDMNTVVVEMLNLLTEDGLTKDIEVEIDLDGSLPAVIADHVQMQQVLVNLIRNAAEAMDGMPNGTRRLVVQSLRNGADSVEIRVADTGSGIDNVDNLFQAFSTTKDGGMGMGLAICRSILSAHGGRISAKSSKSGGSIFSFILPVPPADQPLRSRAQ